MLKGINEIRIMWKNVLAPQSFENLFKEIGIIIQDSIQQRTDRGIDYLNNRFSPYAEVYRQWKIGKGYSGRVNLRLTGQMLDSLEAKPEPKGVVVGFDNSKANDKANYNENGKKQRLFVGIPPDIEKQIDEMVSKHIDNLLGI